MGEQETQRVEYARCDPGVLVQYKDETVEAAPDIRVHYHNGYEMDLFVRSDNLCFIKNTNYPLTDGTLLFINAFDVHTLQYKPNSRYIRYVVQFRRDDIQPVLEAAGAGDLLSGLERQPVHRVSLNQEQYNRIHYLFMDLYQQSREQHGISRILLKTDLCALLAETARVFQDSRAPMPLSPADKLVREMIRFIDEHYMEDIGLQSVVDAFYLNRYYICHLFKKATGTTVVDYLQFRRVIEAQKLLMGSRRSIHEICFDCGFHNLQHFYRVFKKISHVTPAQYRMPEQ